MDTQEESLATQLDCMAFGNGEDTARVEWEKYSKRVLIKNIVGCPDRGQGLVGHMVVVGGWVKTGREQGKNNFVFLEFNDGSFPTNRQLYEHHEEEKKVEVVQKTGDEQMDEYKSAARRLDRGPMVVHNTQANAHLSSSYVLVIQLNVEISIYA